MDPVTHTLIGASIGHAFFKKRVGPEAVPVLCWASNLPDLDVAVLLLRDPLAVTLRRTWGHSVVTAPLLVLAAAWLFTKRYRSLKLPDLIVMCAVGAGAHVIFDLVNSFGVRLTWPLSPWRPELAIVFIIDLFLTGLLLIPYLAYKGDKTKWARIALCLVALYVNVCELSRRRAQALLAPLAQGAEFSYVFPEPLGPHRWRGVARRADGEHSLYLLEPWARRVTGKGKVFSDVHDGDVSLARLTPEGRRLEAFFKAPVWRKDAPGRVTVRDLRFSSLVISREEPFEFTFEDGRLLRGST